MTLPVVNLFNDNKLITTNWMARKILQTCSNLVVLSPVKKESRVLYDT
jgi:hypothetical protein